MPGYEDRVKERSFRTNQVIPCLFRLKHTAYFPIQQQSIRGDADFILCIRGRFVWLELKRAKARPNKLQAYKANWVEKTGGQVFIASPENWGTVKEKLLKMDQGVEDV